MAPWSMDIVSAVGYPDADASSTEVLEGVEMVLACGLETDVDQRKRLESGLPSCYHVVVVDADVVEPWLLELEAQTLAEKKGMEAG